LWNGVRNYQLTRKDYFTLIPWVQSKMVQSKESIVTDVLKTQHNITPISDSELIMKRPIGRGSSAAVSLAQWHGTDVAVKVLVNLDKSFMSDEKIQQFAKEIKLWSQLKSSYIVQFFGVTPMLSIVMEYMEHGNLRCLMRERPLASQTRKRLALHIATGMEFLHHIDVIHRDLNPNNIMVTGPFNQLQAKIADFGLSKKKDDTDEIPVVGTPVYAAPEVLKSYTFSEKSDVYSFGLTLWFMENIQHPFNEIKTWGQLMEVADNNRRPNDDKCSLFRELIRQCWDADPERRPNSSQIVEYLQRLIEP